MINGMKKKQKKKKIKKKKETENECFRCGTPGDLILCDALKCPKGYHLDCLGLETLPKGIFANKCQIFFLSYYDLS